MTLQLVKRIWDELVIGCVTLIPFDRTCEESCSVFVFHVLWENDERNECEFD